MKVTRKILSTREGTFAFAALAAVLAAGALMAFISSYKRSLDARAEPVTVLVAKDGMPKGSSGDVIAEKGLFQATALKREQVKEGAITDPASLRGQVAKHEIVRGQQLTTGDFGKPTDPVLSKLSASDRAVGVSVDLAHGLIGQVQAGDHVDVMAGFLVKPDGAAQPRPIARTLIQDVEVLEAPAPDEKATAGAAAGMQTHNVVLRVEEQDALELAFAADNGKVWIALRPQAGAEQGELSLTNLDRIVTGQDPIPVERLQSEYRELITKGGS
jgi:Flp pilus assembly protein CpaB